MEPVPSRPSFVMGDKGIGQVRRVYTQTGGWISAEVPRPPGYQLAKYIKKNHARKSNSFYHGSPHSHELNVSVV